MINIVINIIWFILLIPIVVIFPIIELILYIFNYSSIFKFVPKKNYYRNKLNLQVLKND